MASSVQYTTRLINTSDVFIISDVFISLVVYCTDEAMKAETRIQLIKSYYVTVVFLAQ